MKHLSGKASERRFCLTAISVGMALAGFSGTICAQTTTYSGGTTQFSLPTGLTQAPLQQPTLSGLRISSDGSVVVGNGVTSSTTLVPYSYTETGGLRLLTTDPGATAGVFDISGDGSFAVGAESGGALPIALKWDLATGAPSVVSVPGAAGAALSAVSTDGKVVGGTAYLVANPGVSSAFIQTLAGATTMLDPGSAYPNGVFITRLNSDGSVAVGMSPTSVGGNFIGLRWTDTTGLVNLGSLNGGASTMPLGVNAKGDVVVGFAADGDPSAGGVPRSFRWTPTGGLVSLGLLHGDVNTYSAAFSVNASGDVVVGASVSLASNESQGYRWTAPTGMQTIPEWLASKGIAVAPGSVKPTDAEAISADGNTVTGVLGDGNIYIARVVATTTPPPGGTDTSPGDTTGSSGDTTSPGGGTTTAPPTTGAGSGMITLSNYVDSLQAASQVASQSLQDASLVLTGEHGSPMRGLISGDQQYVWSTGDWGRADVSSDGHANLGAVEIGYAHGLGERSMAKIAVGRTYSDQDIVSDGNIRTRGTYFLPEFISAIPGTPLYGTLSAYYNFGDADVRRGYDNAGYQVHSTGSPSQHTWAGQARLDWLNAVQGQRFALTPYTAVLYMRSHTASYTESDGGFPVQWDSRNDHSTQARLGLDGVYDLTASLKLTSRIEGVHRFESKGSDADGGILGLTSFSLDGQHYKQNWMRFGVGMEVGAGKGTFSLSGNATTEAETPRYWASVSYRLPF